MHRRWSRGLVVGLSSLALLAAACGGDDDGTGGTQEPTETETQEPTATEEPTEEPTDGGRTLTQQNFSFTPQEFTIETGEDMTVRNGNPTTPHTFTVTGENVDVSNNGGESTELRIELAPGTYDFICRFHSGQGMTGTLIVTEST